jgi:hypothetical protein
VAQTFAVYDAGAPARAGSSPDLLTGAGLASLQKGKRAYCFEKKPVGKG